MTREFYESAYALEGEEAARMGRWRAIGARSKADHVETLLRKTGVQPASIVEIGCGSGDVLAELHRRRLSPVLDGFELSRRAAEIAGARGVARRIETFDGEHVPAETSAYDLAILTHVIEHVRDPLPLLKEAARVAPNVIVEVPLEDNRSARRPAKRKLAEAAGHMQALSRSDVRRLVREAGMTVREELTDPLSYEHVSFFGGAPKGALKWALRRALHGLGLAERLVTVHYAVLATRA